MEEKNKLKYQATIEMRITKKEATMIEMLREYDYGNFEIVKKHGNPESIIIKGRKKIEEKIVEK